MEFELVLPCYNESKSLKALIERAKAAAEKESFTSNQFRLILVENGSRDNSQEVLAELKKSDLSSWFHVVSVNPNEGYGNGIWQGLKATSAPVVGWSHADQQCDPADAFKAHRELLRLEKESGVPFLVKGTRHGRNWKDKIVSAVFAFCARRILGIKVSEINAQPKVFRRNLLNELPHPPKDFFFDLFFLYQAQKRRVAFSSIPVLFPPRVHGLSNWSAHFFSRYKTIARMIQSMWELREKEGRLQ